MKEVTMYQCEYCGNTFPLKSACLQNEESCKWKDEGHDVWYENGKAKHCEPISSEAFGPHTYADHDGTSDYKHGCGCWAGPSRSGGPFNPFGPCPNNRKLSD